MLIASDPDCEDQDEVYIIDDVFINCSNSTGWDHTEKHVVTD